jgi:hypothetical protein
MKVSMVLILLAFVASSTSYAKSPDEVLVCKILIASKAAEEIDLKAGIPAFPPNKSLEDMRSVQARALYEMNLDKRTQLGAIIEKACAEEN